MRRRTFLKLAGAGTAAVAVLPVGLYKATSLQEAAAGIITRQFSYLKLEPKGVARFVDDYFKDPMSQFPATKVKLYYFLQTGVDQAKVADMTSKYLLSSDFFINKMDDNKTVQYLSFYNPYLRPCANPFSSLHYPDVLS